MASLFSFGEDNGAATGSPAKGTTRTLNRSECNWKNIDDSTSVYSSYPITAGGNSFSKYQFGVFTGTFNTISNCKFNHTSGTFGAGITLKCNITSGYTTPATGNLANAYDITTTGLVANGSGVLLGSVGPEQATGTSLGSVATGYSQFIITQLQTTTGASPGDTALCQLSFSYDES